MKRLDRLQTRVAQLEQKVIPELMPVYVSKVEGWGFGIQFPGDPQKRDWPWDPRCMDPETRKDACMIGAAYMISSEGPGRRFENREAAERWIEEDKKKYPLNTFEWKQRIQGNRDEKA